MMMCSYDRSAAPSAPVEPALSAAQVVAVMERSQLRHGRQSMEWVADLHTRAMQQWMTERAGRTLSKQAACARVHSLARSFLPEARSAAGLSNRAVDDLYERSITASGVRHGCDVRAAALSIWPVASLNRVTAQDQDTVTGAYEEFVPLIESATTVGTPEGVVQALDGVLSQASLLPSPDYLVLAAMASLAASSAWYWFEYERTTGGGDDSTPVMSIFAYAAGRFSWRYCLGADLAGGLAAVRAGRLIGATHPFLIGALLFGGAAVGSAWYAYENQE